MARTGWLLSALVVLGFVVGFGLLAAPATGNDAPDDPLAQTDIDADTIVMDVTLDENGNGDWRVVYRLQLDSDEEIAAFEELREEIEDDPGAYLDPFEDRILRTVESARTTTEREMSAENFEIHAERQTQPDAEFGEVTFQFEWNGFAAVEDDGETIRAGDSLDRLFLDEDTSLQIHWPAAYHLQSHAPTAAVVEETRVVWRGPVDFGGGEPRVEITSAGDPNGDDVAQTPSDDEGIGSMLWVVVGAALVAGGVGVWFFVRTRSPSHADSSGESATDHDDGGTNVTDGPPPELLSNEERVLRLLDRHGGRIKQKEVAEQLDWTAAKTSQIVGDLRDGNEIEVFRLGRENVLTLPDVDIADAGDDSSSDAPSDDR